MQKEYTNSQIRELIDEYIHSERDRCILKRHLIDGISYEPLAEEFKLSRSQIARIVPKCERVLFRNMTTK
jgi:predicted DNA-binding protein YlxM (UPF0122 family)